ncbi:hypothetical protein EVAR_51764_1 [Eumeta japonica]|uniref:Uncharacterized protein n=1 Tax=Eumeta variegata TaxID=151549 RepID=A0A4C1XFB4_EUMVA|nr:hypothetical protein EVAR_51764_1 [Eumeta japonica]
MPIFRDIYNTPIRVLSMRTHQQSPRVAGDHVRSRRTRTGRRAVRAPPGVLKPPECTYTSAASLLECKCLHTGRGRRACAAALRTRRRRQEDGRVTRHRLYLYSHYLFLIKDYD